MKKKFFNLGFTLIELLAVIVILAIIAVIATPIVLDVINDVKESSKIKTANLYLSAVNVSVINAINETNGEFYPKKCLININGNLNCAGYDKEIVVDIDGEKPDAGEILFKNKEINTANIIYYDVAISRDAKGNFSYDSTTYKKVLAVNDIKYSLDKFNSAVESSTETNPARLLEDISISDIVTINADKEMFLDLNGKTITIKSGDIILLGKNSKLTVKSGTIKALGNSGGITIGKDNDDVSLVEKRHLVVEKDLTIEADTYGIAGFGKSTIDFYGSVFVTNNGYGISGNGDINNENTIFNIYPGSKIIAEKGVALYLPQTGITTIYGGLLKGSTTIGIKSGELNIKDGEFYALGPKKEAIARPNATQNGGLNSTGDVILIEEQIKYNGNIVVNITGGKLESTNGYIIQENNTTGRTVTVTGIYTNKNLINNSTSKYYYTK